MAEGIADERTHLRCKVIIEVLGKPKEHVEKSIGMYVDKIKQDSGLVVLNGEFADAEEKEGMWSTFVDLEMVIKGIPKLIAFCFDYMPSSIQVIKPEEFMMKRASIESFINDLQARLHNVDMIVKKQKNQNDFLRKNMNKAIRNVILVSLGFGSLNFENLSRITGIQKDELKPFVDKLVEEGKIEDKEGTYILVKNVENVKE